MSCKVNGGRENERSVRKRRVFSFQAFNQNDDMGHRPVRHYLGYQIFKGPALSHTDAVVVLTTIANEEEAVTLIRELLDRRLIACGTVQPGARSLYRWEGKVADEKEAMVLLKTRSGCIEGLRRAFAELHPYKVPELLAIPVTGGLERYLGWINSETSLTIA